MHHRDLKEFDAHAAHCMQCAGAALDEPIGEYCVIGNRLLDEAWQRTKQSSYRVSVTPYGTTKVKITHGATR